MKRIIRRRVLFNIPIYFHKMNLRPYGMNKWLETIVERGYAMRARMDANLREMNGWGICTYSKRLISTSTLLAILHRPHVILSAPLPRFKRICVVRHIHSWTRLRQLKPVMFTGNIMACRCVHIGVCWWRYPSGGTVETHIANQQTTC